MNTKLHKRIKKIKQELELLYQDFREDTLIKQSELELSMIPDNLSKAQFKRIVSEQVNLLNRNVIDRLFLQKMDILEVRTSRKQKTF